MKKCNEFLQKRLSTNLKVLREAKAALSKIGTKGNLYICHANGRSNYYRCDEADSNSRTYISKSNTKLIAQLANKRYCQKVINALEEENAWLNKTIKSMPNKTYETVFNDNLELRSLIKPFYLNDEELIRTWNESDYIGNPYKPENKKFKTKRGEYVRSKSEKMIADRLFELGIPYKYEYPILVDGKTRYVDFFILSVPLRKAFIYEHFGMMSSQEYVKDAVSRIHAYEKAGIRLGDRLIATFEYDNEIDLDVFETIIKAHLGIV